ncbi:uncharacterized protein LOC134217226 isoform X2 [Armigeres subalbatus]|uniref:uncharacterized protein LOC134217226 isoform X2 n=1 Tax=Armigeres subalbatus TaxID=124917 RepID=UPI002ED04FA4
MFFVISLDPLIKQGQTQYNFLITLLHMEEEAGIELPEDEMKEKYEDTLTHLSGPVYEVLVKVKVINNRKMTGSGTFIVSRQAEDDRHGHRIQERETRKGGAHQRIRYRPELLKFVGSYGSRVFMKNEFPIGHAGEGTANARLELGNDSLQGQCAVIRCGKQNQH